MSEDEVVVDQDQESDQEPVEEVVEGFEGEGEPDETPAPAEAESEPAEEKKAESQDSEVKADVESLKRQIHDLNRALHNERQKKTEDDEVLTPEQLKAFLKEHKDDPEALYNLTAYVARQAAKEQGNASQAAQKAQALKSQTESFIYQRFPELQDTTSPAFSKVNEIRNNLNLSDHPAGVYLAASTMLADNIENLKKHWYEEGKKEGLKGKTEINRKQSIEDTKLMPSSKSNEKPSDGITPGMKETIKQMGLSPEAAKIYAKLVRKGA